MGRQNQREKAEQFRDNLRALIRHQGWTQREAAKHVALDYVTLRKYLSMGLANVTDKNRSGLERICQKLGVGKIELLWATRLKPGSKSLINAEAEADDTLYQLRQLLWSVHSDTSAVKKICTAIESTFNKLVCGITEAKERARGGSFVDNDTRGKIVRRNRRLGGGRKKKDEDY